MNLYNSPLNTSKEMGGISELVLVLSLVTVVTPGFQYRGHNATISPNSSCSLIDYVSRAQCVQTHYNLVCRGGFSRQWINGIKQDIIHLRVLEWPGECFNMGSLQHHFPSLRFLEFINCTSLKSFKGHFDAHNQIERLSMHGLMSLWEVPSDVTMEMPQLQELDLRRNMLRHIKYHLLNKPPRLQRIHLSDNHWDCSDGGLDWLAMEPDDGPIKGRIVDYYDLICNQQLYRGKPLHKVMDIIRTMRETCPNPCTCVLTHVVSDSAGAVIPLITVDCSKRQLDGPPASLPPSTTTLRLEGNKINTIRTLVHNPQYKKLADLYLDNNSISAVKELEGSEWFSTFRVLSLRGNMLKQIPVYAFDKAFQANNNIMHVFLGLNPWRCDCHYIPRFQTLLLKYRRVIRDLPDIRCSKSDDKKTSLVQEFDNRIIISNILPPSSKRGQCTLLSIHIMISTIPLGNVCGSSEVEMPISLINIINLVLFALILLIVGRFLYDWHNFKSTGKLPWLSSILP